MKSGSRKTTIGRLPRRPTMTAPWPCRCSSIGCRADATRGLPLGGLKVEIGPDRNVVRRLLPGPHMAVDPDPGEPVAGLRREQQMVDAQSPVFLPCAGLIIPERVLARSIVDGS